MKYSKYGIVRDIPNSYQKYYLDKNIYIDYKKAKIQHREYIKSLKWLGIDNVILLPEDESYPDCCFVEDCAVVHDDKVLICNMGSDYRRGEIDEVEKFFRNTHKIIKMRDPAFLEGGDVLVLGKKVFVGISRVSNELSLECLSKLFGREFQIVPVKVEKTLHLKTACSGIGEDAVLLCPYYVDPNIFDGYNILRVPKEEFFAANCLAIGEKVVIPTGAERTLSILKDEGYKVKCVDISEFMLADGSLTCLSIIY